MSRGIFVAKSKSSKKTTGLRSIGVKLLSFDSFFVFKRPYQTQQGKSEVWLTWHQAKSNQDEAATTSNGQLDPVWIEQLPYLDIILGVSETHQNVFQTPWVIQPSWCFTAVQRKSPTNRLVELGSALRNLTSRTASFSNFLWNLWEQQVYVVSSFSDWI